MISITGVHIPRILPAEVIDRMLVAVSAERRQIAQKFQRQEDVQRSLIGELLLFHILQHRYGLDSTTLKLSKNSYGKPYLNEYPDIHFNISHAGEWVICADGPLPVGVDIEQVRPIDFAIAERFFTAAEYEQLLFAPEEKRLQLFYTLWTLKESYIKFVGKGLSIPLDSFGVHLLENDTAQLIPIPHHEPMTNTLKKNDITNCFFRKINVDAHYQLAVCSSQFFGPKPLIMLKWTELLPAVSL